MPRCLVVLALFAAAAAATAAPRAAAAGSAPSTAQDPGWARVVTITDTGAAVRTVIAGIAVQSDLKLQVGREFAGSSLVVIAHQRPALEVMNAIARLLGARWYTSPGSGKPTYEMRRLPAVARWRDACIRDELGIPAAARAAEAAAIRAALNAAKKNSTSAPPDAATDPVSRFILSLPDPVQEAGVEAAAAREPLFPWESRSNRTVTGAFTLRYNQLPPAAQQLLGGILLHGPKNMAPMNTWINGELDVTTEAMLPLATISFPSGMEGSLGIDAQLPTRFGRRDNAFAGIAYRSIPPAERWSHAEDAAEHSMAAHKPPAEAYPGPWPDDALNPVRLSAEVKALPLIPETTRPLRREFLLELAQRTGLELVADDYLLSQRLPIAGATVGDRVRTAARVFDSGFWQDGRYLYVRRRGWPVDDLKEPPRPLSEALLTAARANRPLTLAQLCQLAALTDWQLLRLWEYQDGSAQLQPAIKAAAARADIRACLAAFGTLPEQSRRQATSNAGLPVASIPLTTASGIEAAMPDAFPGSAAPLALRVSPGFRAGPMTMQDGQSSYVGYDGKAPALTFELIDPATGNQVTGLFALSPAVISPS